MKIKLSLILIALCNFAFAQNGFVKLKNNQFYVDDEVFYPISVNLSFSKQNEGSDTTYSLSGSYCHFKCGSNAEARQMIVDDLLMLWNNGFNSIRLDGLQVFADEKRHDLRNLNKEPLAFPYSHHIQRIKTVLDVIEKNVPEMKVVLLTGDDKVDVVEKEYATYLRRLAYELKDYKSIMAFDLINEPEYGGAATKDKEEALRISTYWYRAIKDVNPNLLVTYGLTIFDCIYAWDPNVIALDFISYHVYQRGSDNFSSTRTKLHWAAKTATKPWILGETGIAAADTNAYTWISRCDDITNEEKQADFIKRSLELTKDCGCIGYQYWHHREVSWYEEKYGNPCSGSRGLDANHFGLIYHQRSKYKPNEPKLGWYEFKKHIESNYKAQPSNCTDPLADNNKISKPKASLIGQVVDENNQAVPYAWVSIRHYRDDGKLKQVRRMTDSLGRFYVTRRAFKTVSEVSATASGYNISVSIPTKNKYGILMRYKPLTIIVNQLKEENTVKL